MTTYSISAPQQLRTTVALPASKSISNRVLIINALSANDQLPQNLSDCDDTEVMVKALSEQPETIDIKAAGTAMRFMTAYLAATPLPYPNNVQGDLQPSRLLTGTERMKHRPIKVLVDALRHLGANIEYAGQEGFPPLKIRGEQLDGGELEVAGNISSQFISALLLIGPVLRKGLTLKLSGTIISRPYIDLTLWTMREFGADADWTAADTIEVRPKPYTKRSYLIENDWSAASYWYEMVALSTDEDAEVKLEGLMDASKQGDSTVRYIFSLLGVKTTFQTRVTGKPTTVTLKKNGQCVKKLDYDFNNAPDLAQTIVCTCCALGVPFHFTGLQTLRIKETDRIAALKTELRKLGFDIDDINGNELLWDGKTHPSTLSAPPSIDTYEDHRMALAFAPLSLRMPLSINNPKVVSKSYPQFWHHLSKAGFTYQ